MDPDLVALLTVARRVRDAVRRGFARNAELASAEQGFSDLQYPVDRLAEEGLASLAASAFPAGEGLRLLWEGGDESGVSIHPGPRPRLLVLDPVDGTRGLMHDKRSAWFLGGIHPPGANPSLRGLTRACLVEIPPTRSHLSDVLLWAGGALHAWTESLESGGSAPLSLRPSAAPDLLHGFATVSRFLWRDAAWLGRLQDALLARLYPDDPDAGRLLFEDQYISNGGQLHALITGRDRFVLDVRPLIPVSSARPPLCSHPYDLLALPIAEAAGVIVTDPRGRPLDAPLDLSTPVAWAGYANAALRARIEPALLAVLAELRPA